MSEAPNPAWNTAIRTGYDRWALVYDHDGNPLVALEEPFVRVAVGDVRGQAVLDLGCGTGRHTLWLAQAGATVTAVDFSEGMLAAARQMTQALGVARFGEPAEIARVVAFLASPQAGYCHGAVLDVDGGQTRTL